MVYRNYIQQLRRKDISEGNLWRTRPAWNMRAARVEEDSCIIHNCIIRYISAYLVHKFFGNISARCMRSRFSKSEADRFNHPCYYFTFLKAYHVPGRLYVWKRSMSFHNYLFFFFFFSMFRSLSVHFTCPMLWFFKDLQIRCGQYKHQQLHVQLQRVWNPVAEHICKSIVKITSLPTEACKMYEKGRLFYNKLAF